MLKAERVIRQESAQSDINRQLNEKRKNLIEILSNELCPAADRSLRAGARGQRLPAKLLIELGQERKAAKLFLKSRSEAQRYSQKSIRIGNDYSLRYIGATNRVSVGDRPGNYCVIYKTEGNLLLYSTKFSRSFFDHLRETAKEFNHDFESKPVNFSALGNFYKTIVKNTLHCNTRSRVRTHYRNISILFSFSTVSLHGEVLHSNVCKP